MNKFRNLSLVFTFLFAMFLMTTDAYSQRTIGTKTPIKKSRFEGPTDIQSPNHCYLYPPGVDACQLVEDANFQDKDGDTPYIEENNNGGNYVIATPHGRFDEGTRAIVEGIDNNNAMAWRSLSFNGFRREPLYFNVNRPTLLLLNNNPQIPDYKEEQIDSDAKKVYNCYVDHIKGLVPLNSLEWYVEIHGNAKASRAGFLDIASQEGMSESDAEDIQEIFQDALDAENIPLTVAMEHTDEDPHFHGTASREYGLICVLENANVPFLHIEIPSAYRKNNQVANRNKMIDALSSALAQVKAANLID
ncbi:MAG: hypothetical protein AB8B69_11880 [Chitinophagales bacterium]